MIFLLRLLPAKQVSKVTPCSDRPKGFTCLFLNWNAEFIPLGATRLEQVKLDVRAMRSTVFGGSRDNADGDPIIFSDFLFEKFEPDCRKIEEDFNFRQTM